MENSYVYWPCSFFLRLAGGFWRCPSSRRNVIIVGVCLVHVFMVLQVGLSWPSWDRRSERHRSSSRGVYDVQGEGGTTDSLTGRPNADATGPNRSNNVVYITLRSKRFKPAVIRGTVRPKLRRKTRRKKPNKDVFTPNRDRDAESSARTSGSNNASRTEIRSIDYASFGVAPPSEADEPQHHVSSIRIYSQEAPPWFSPEDVAAMRFLADAKVSRLREVSPRAASTPFWVFESESETGRNNRTKTRDLGLCPGQCGVIGGPVDTVEVFAFHLDRVLGLNRTLPAVSRQFGLLHDGQPCPVVLWDTSLHPESLTVGGPAVRLTWGEYQDSLKQQCWHRNVKPKPDSGCSPIHHYEWSKLALFDFLLQVHQRLDGACCGFKPRAEDVCVKAAACGDRGGVALGNILHRGHDPRRLVFAHNKGFFDRNEDNLDYRLLEGIKELPQQAVNLLQSGKLRERLLQSLFLDQSYWASQGGRRGIDKLIEVIQRRAAVLLTYVDAHGIKVAPMRS